MVREAGARGRVFVSTAFRSDCGGRRETIADPVIDQWISNPPLVTADPTMEPNIYPDGRLSRLLIVAAALMAVLATRPAQAFVASVTWVSDGDTLWAQPAAGGAPRNLRIIGIDAPELCQPGGAAARVALQRLVLRQTVQVSPHRVDSYGRVLATLRVNGRDVGEQMVLQGQAWSYRWRRDPGPYAAQEVLARKARRGLFAGADALHPRDFRRRHGPCEQTVR